jgi:hypothetical protein
LINQSKSQIPAATVPPRLRRFQLTRLPHGVALRRQEFELENFKMTVTEALRAMAGIVILLTLALGYWVNPYWYFFTAFVGLNLLQSAFTKWCPAMTIFRKLGLKES